MLSRQQKSYPFIKKMKQKQTPFVCTIKIVEQRYKRILKLAELAKLRISKQPFTQVSAQAELSSKYCPNAELDICIDQ